MKSVFYIKLVFLALLAVAPMQGFSQTLEGNVFTVASCSQRQADNSLLCGFGDTIEESGEDFCLQRYGVTGPRDGQLFNAAHGSYQCTQAIIEQSISFAGCGWSIGRCPSIPPATPLESHFYKPLDGFTSSPSQCVSCACEGEQWTHVNSGVVIGCLAPKPVKDKPCGDTVGNPCNPANGNKYATEVDFSNNELSFTRYYNSGNLSNYGLGVGWTSNHHQRLVINDAGDELMRVAGDGSGEPWRGSTSGGWDGDADSDILLAQTGTGFQVTLANDDLENYGDSGLLLSKVDSNGLITSYEYNDNQRLERVTNHYGHSISFDYDANNYMTSVTDANGVVYTYEYDQNRATAVIYPDTTLSNDDNPRRQYRYSGHYVGETRFLFHALLSEIVDENGDRYAFYSYYSSASPFSGRARRTSHASTTNFFIGQERFDLEYQD